MTDSLRAIAFTYRGLVREGNQDTIAVGAWVTQEDMHEARVLTAGGTERAPISCLVADGLGGHVAGEVASRLVAQHIAAATLAPDDDPTAVARALMHSANACIDAAVAATPALAGMGTTIAGVLIRGSRLAVFNVGDSRVYRWQDGYLNQLSVDDSVPQHHGILQCLGGSDGPSMIAPHVFAEEWLPGRRYLICSDGLSSVIDLEVIEAALALPSEEAIAELRVQVEAAGAPDNLSIVLLERP